MKDIIRYDIEEEGFSLPLPGEEQETFFDFLGYTSYIVDAAAETLGYDPQSDQWCEGIDAMDGETYYYLLGDLWSSYDGVFVEDNHLVLSRQGFEYWAQAHGDAFRAHIDNA